MTVLDELKSRGHWRVTIRPTAYIADRVRELGQLERIMEAAHVRIRGWDYPHTRQQGPVRGKDWVGSEDTFGHHMDLWRLYQSGQFVHYRAMGDDWRDVSGLWPAPEGWEVGTGMGWGDAAYQYVEIFEFAARLALSSAGAERMTVRTEVSGIKGRTLINDSRGGWIDWRHTSNISSYEQQTELSREELVAQARRLGLSAARALFERFGWDVSEEVLRSAVEGT